MLATEDLGKLCKQQACTTNYDCYYTLRLFKSVVLTLWYSLFHQRDYRYIGAGFTGRTPRAGVGFLGVTAPRVLGAMLPLDETLFCIGWNAIKRFMHILMPRLVRNIAILLLNSSRTRHALHCATYRAFSAR